MIKESTAVETSLAKWVRTVTIVTDIRLSLRIDLCNPLLSPLFSMTLSRGRAAPSTHGVDGALEKLSIVVLLDL